MHNLTAFTVENVVYFKKPVRFEFTKGLTFIQGRNKQRRGPTASNGSGKSLLFGTLPNLLLDTHAVVTKNTKQAQRQVYGAKSSSTIEFATSKAKYVYTKAGAKTSLSKNGEDQKSRIARDQLKGLLQLSSEEFFATVYLDSRRPNSFQLGTSADRFQFITNLFRLHNIDEFRKHINRQLSDLGRDTRVLEQTSTDLADVTAELKDLSRTAGDEAGEISTWIKSASKQAQKLTALKHQQENYNRWRVEVKKLEALDRPERKLSAITADIKALDAYEARLDSYTEQKAKQRKLQDELDALGDVDVKELDSMERLRSTLDDDLEAPEAPETPLGPAKKVADRMPLAKVLRLESKFKAQLSVAKDQLNTFESEVGDADDCPTCHSPLTKSTKKNIVALFVEQQKDIENKLAKVKKVVAAHKTVEQWSEFTKHKTVWDLQQKVRAKVLKYPFREAKRHVQLTELLAELHPEKPAKVDLDRNVLVSERKAYDAWRRQKELVDSMRTDKPEGEASDTDVEEINKKVEEAMIKLPGLQAIAAERKAKLSIKKELANRVMELSTALEDLPVYQMLSSSYSTKGIKVLLVQRIAKALESNLNKHARQIFSEDFNFSFNVSEGKFDVMVSRKIGRKLESSDIRHLSGAESRSFIFLFVRSLLPLIPDSRRFNALILDEPDANMDPEARETFRDVLLPMLSKVVPSVVVISPNSDIIPHHARVLTVVKDKGESTLVEGIVS